MLCNAAPALLYSPDLPGKRGIVGRCHVLWAASREQEWRFTHARAQHRVRSHTH
jgi:hypothetical protein